jgi:ComF family protein
MIMHRSRSGTTRWGRFLRRASRWKDIGCDLLFPPHCAHCDVDLTGAAARLLLCDDCGEKLGPADWASCLQCGAPSSPDRKPPESCEFCRGAALRFDTAFSLGVYQGELREVVLKMKNRFGDPLSEAMGRLLSLRTGRRLASLRVDAVLPVPMFWRRRLRRGTNSAAILADRLARHLRLPLASQVVYRARNTLPQATLRPRQRFRNVRGAFRLNAGYHLDGLRLVLVDDVLTTGATCDEVARLLKQAGASMVVATVVARGVGADTS